MELLAFAVTGDLCSGAFAIRDSRTGSPSAMMGSFAIRTTTLTTTSTTAAITSAMATTTATTTAPTSTASMLTTLMTLMTTATTMTTKTSKSLTNNGAPNLGVIVGGAIGGFVALLLLVLIIFVVFFYKPKAATAGKERVTPVGDEPRYDDASALGNNEPGTTYDSFN